MAILRLSHLSHKGAFRHFWALPCSWYSVYKSVDPPESRNCHEERKYLHLSILFWSFFSKSVSVGFNGCFTQKSGNFGWNVNGRLILSPRNKFSRENGISWKVDKKCMFQLLEFTTSRPFGFDRLWSYLPRKSLGNGTSAFPGKLPFTTTVDQPIFQSKMVKNRTNVSGVIHFRKSWGGWKTSSRQAKNLHELFAIMAQSLRSFRILPDTEAKEDRPLNDNSTEKKNILNLARKRTPYFLLCCTKCSTIVCPTYVPVKSKLKHPPRATSRATPRAFEVLENFCSNFLLPRPKSCSNAPF